MPEETKKITGEVEIKSEVSEKIKKETKDIPDFKKEITDSLGEITSKIVETILAGAFYLEASDIHIEPEQDKAKLRIRLDGILQDVLELDLKIYKTLTSRIKLLSELKLNVADRPQDGRFSILIEGISVEIRTSSIPAEYGESLVLRILNPKSLVSMKDLGLRKDLFELFQKEIKKPNGMIVCTGPTGSGKTTTLYAFLKELTSPEIKIITIEDPIEYHLQGISQTQTDKAKGYGFANGLKAIVRQDPDVILVGEIRDLETAKIALQAALTGHLVFSTIHTNDATGTIARLQALGEKPVNIAPSLNMAIAQRLVRKLCQECKQSSPASEKEKEEIKKSLKKNIKDVFKAKGCKKCGNTGYKGRIGVFEAFVIDDEIEKFILKSPSIVELRDLAIKKGMITMRQDGLMKVLEGVTTIEEIDKAIGEE